MVLDVSGARGLEVEVPSRSRKFPRFMSLGKKRMAFSGFVAHFNTAFLDSRALVWSVNSKIKIEMCCCLVTKKSVLLSAALSGMSGWIGF